MNCHEAIAELFRSLDAGTPISDAARDHFRECSRCRALLATLTEEEPEKDRSAEEPSLESTAAAAEAALKKERVKRMAGRWAALMVVAVVVVLTISSIQARAFPGEIAAVVFIGVILFMIFVGLPFLLLFHYFANAKTEHGEHGFYKRLGPGRWLGGVCLGIAEAKGWSVALVRAVFLLLAWFKGIGVLAYVICVLAMPVYPGDRRYLLRFKIARAWRRFRGSPDDEEFSRA